MSSTFSHFRVDPRLATLLGETYRSSEQAIKELVDNAWDANADNVWVDLPEPMTVDPIDVRDDGDGMTSNEMESDYLKVARDRRTARGEWTPIKNRRVKGRRGIGKFAGLLVADLMTVLTRSRGKITQLTIPRKDLIAAAGDLESFSLPVKIEPCDPGTHGTTVRLQELHQRLSFPSPEKLKQLLILEYGREAGFNIYVNGQALSIKDIPGEVVTREDVLPLVGRIRLLFKISDGKHPLKQAGIAIRVVGKIVGRPIFFGLEDDEEVPKPVLRRLYGEVEADGLAEELTADWNNILENSKAFQQLEEYMRPLLKAELQKAFKREFSLTKARLQHEIDRRLAKLPQYRREYARRALERIMQQFYGESEQRIAPIISVVLDAFERDEYWQILKQVHDARRADVQVFAEALDSFGLLDMAFISKQARGRLSFLDELDTLLLNPRTTEKAIHKALERNLWVLGSEFALLSSNETLHQVVARYTNEKFSGKNASRRPDLFLANRANERYVLVEFKRPKHELSRVDEQQAQQYRDDLVKQFSPMEIVLVAGSVPAELRLNSGKDVTYLTFAALVDRTRQEMKWLLGEITTYSAAS